MSAGKGWLEFIIVTRMNSTRIVGRKLQQVAIDYIEDEERVLPFTSSYKSRGRKCELLQISFSI